MRIYISGKITGTDDYMERFYTAEDKLKADGWEVINPAKTNATLPVMEHKDYMAVSFLLLGMCDAIYMMKGWKESAGACMEYGYAMGTDKIITME